jgi:hypothetical protein
MTVNSLKKYIISAGLALAIGLSSYSSKAATICPTDTVGITTQKGAGKAYHITQPEAEKSLDALCRYKTTDKEDAWIYCDNKLIDVGQNEKSNRISLSDELMDTCINKTNPGDTITMYHIHPKAYFGNRFHPACTGDILTHISIKSPEYTKGRTIIAKVFDGRGMWEFDADEQYLIDTTLNWGDIKKQFNNINDAITGKYNTDMWDHTNTIPRKGKQKSRPSRTLNQYDPISVQKYINKLDKLGIKLKYTPTEEIQGR